MRAFIKSLVSTVRRPLLVRLHDEKEQAVPKDWLLPNVERRSIRSDRNHAIEQAMKEVCVQPDVMCLEDFSYRRAFEVFDECGDRDFYVVLSDEVALALQGLLLRVGKDQPRIIGYDFSFEARSSIPSFDQGLDHVAVDAFQHLAEIWHTGADIKSLKCKEVLHEVVLRAIPF